VDWIQDFSLWRKFSSILRFEDRIVIWEAAWHMFQQAPLLGNGTRTFGLMFDSTIQRLDLDWTTLPVRSTPWAHNLYLETLAEQGVVGLAVLLFTLGRAHLLGWIAWKCSMSNQKPVVAACLASLVAFEFAALFEVSFVRLWALVAFMTTLGLISTLVGNIRDRHS
jgi:O-antigen ligase